MKRLLVCFLICVITIASFAVPSFAESVNGIDFSNQPIPLNDEGILQVSSKYGISSAVDNIYAFATRSTLYNVCWVSESSQTVSFKLYNNSVFQGNFTVTITLHDTNTDLYYRLSNIDSVANTGLPQYDSTSLGLVAVRDYIDNPPSQITKNAHVDEFLANTLISMGFKFSSSSDAISLAQASWTWCTDEENTTSNGFQTWNVDSFASYCNAQSNNYENWYQGYKVSSHVVNGLAQFIHVNRSLDGTISGITPESVNEDYYPIIKYGSGFNSTSTTATANTFYPASTITYVNGEYITSDGITTSQFLYSPSDVRHFLGSSSAPAVTAPDSSGSGTVTDGNGDKVYDIDIDFPSLDWLADAIQSLLNFLRELIDTVSNLISKVIDTLERLFSDAFESLSEFGQGFLDFIQNFFSSFSGLGSKYIPTDLWTIIVTFIALNIGIGLLLFVLRGH